MKTRLAITLMLTAICLSLITTGVGTAQRDNFDTVDLDYRVYLPFISVPPCTFTDPEAYVSVSNPVVRVGEIVTVTGTLVNICSPIGNYLYYLKAEPEGVLYPSQTTRYGDPPAIGSNSYEDMTFTVQAVGAGVVTVTVGVGYEWWDPPIAYWDGVGSSPSVMRVLP